MMAEREDIAAKRAACQAALRALREAQATIETLPQVCQGRRMFLADARMLWNWEGTHMYPSSPVPA